MPFWDIIISTTLLILLLPHVLIKDGFSAFTKKYGIEGSSLKAALAVFGITVSLYRVMKRREKALEKDDKMVYGLQHGRLHIQTPTAMWMSM